MWYTRTASQARQDKETSAMTPEHIERAIQFLLEQQAAFEAALQKSRELFNQSWEKTQAEIRETHVHLRETDAHIRETDVHIRQTDGHIREVAGQIQLLKDACR